MLRFLKVDLSDRAEFEAVYRRLAPRARRVAQARGPLGTYARGFKRD